MYSFNVRAEVQAVNIDQVADEKFPPFVGSGSVVGLTCRSAPAHTGEKEPFMRNHVEPTAPATTEAHKRRSITRVELRLPTDVAALLYAIAEARGQTISRVGTDVLRDRLPDLKVA